MLRMNREGNILEVITSPYDNPQNLDSLLLNKNIRDFFFLPENQALFEMSFFLTDHDEKGHIYDHCYPSKNQFESFQVFYEIYAKCPYSRISFCHINEDEIYGMVRYYGFVYRLLPFNKKAFVLLAQNGEITAFNQRFLDIFQPRRLMPKEILGQPVARLISPNPLEILMGHEQEFSAHLFSSEWKEEIFLDFPLSLPAALKTVFAEKGRLTAQGLYWEPSKQQFGFLPVGQPFDFSRSDFKIEVLLQTGTGYLPSIVLGALENYQILFPDYQGYLLGPVSNPARWSKGEIGWLIL